MAIGTHRTFLSYIDKSRGYYLAKGTANPYRWASFDDVPFTAPGFPLAELRVGLVTTASLGPPPTKGAKRAYAAPVADRPNALFTNDLFWHKTATHTDDLGTYLPLAHLEALEAEGSIGSLSPRWYGAPTAFSQRATLTRDAPEILEWCRDDGVDVALLVPL